MGRQAKRTELIKAFALRFIEVELNERFGETFTGTITVIQDLDFGKDNKPIPSLHCRIEKQRSRMREDESWYGLSIVNKQKGDTL